LGKEFFSKLGRRLFRVTLHPILGGIALACLLFSTVAVAADKAAPPEARLRGTFLQLTEAQGGWKEADWAKLFGYFKELQLSQLIIQWTVYDDLAFFQGENLRQVANPPLATILNLADAAGMQVIVGLTHDSGFWEKINRDPELVGVFLRRQRLRDETLVSQLLPQLQGHSSFRGWYIPEEVDDINWQDAPARQVLFAYLRDLSAYLHKAAPGSRVAISGFTNGRIDPKALGRFWQNMLAETSIDDVLFQDGVGAGKLLPEEVPVYLEALRQAVQSQARKLQVVVELFRQVSERPFRAQPASWDRVARQLEIAARYATGGIVAFSVPEYLTPMRGPEADKLFKSYLNYIRVK
jgi:hypothetical protein